ncbi:peptide chain release factor N(5)-glutamine methyltransferase [Desulfobulbus alkaliphilus]|uniref:peptide chain release factor N(5)-glutamine methyltransferase n=1 Tax=Desulfobulbus alkaliphilus TaxID=869814 RepID=UPI001963EDE6|nr:peptide chain release factor N(5)-glutamine methyltransferase [Desulfobulbus alkaliphilus]MBM9536380.1 peptide chain release factor N(5)-glutamine methyltransferase [Desulfobulbus alkaliphilus]
MTVDVLLKAAEAQLAEVGVENAGLEARLLLQHLTGMNRSELILHGGRCIDASMGQQYQQMVDRRRQRVPLQYITGSQEFWSLDFFVSPAVLIPRPETEFVLEHVLTICPPASAVRSALDMCTGSGVMAVVLARELKCSVVAVDISPSALAVATKNLDRHGVAGLVSLVCGDLFTALHCQQKFDLIVSNPPYIPEGLIDRLAPEVGRAEPRLALSGGADGLVTLQRLAHEAQAFLMPGGWVFVEIGADQKEAALALFTAPGRCYEEVRVFEDWGGRPRVVQARLSAHG